MIRYLKSFFITAALFGSVIYSIVFLLKPNVAVPKKNEPKVIHIRAVKIVKKTINKKRTAAVSKIREKIVEENIIEKQEINKVITTKKKTVRKEKNIDKKVVKKRQIKPNKRKLKVKKRVAIKKVTNNKSRHKKYKRSKARVKVIKKSSKVVKKSRVKKGKLKSHKKLTRNRINRTTKAYMSKSNPALKENFLASVRGKIKANIQYPPSARASHTEGRVEVLFNITASGGVSNIRFIKAKRVFRKSIKKAFRRVFPVNVPANIKASAPLKDIYLPFDFAL